MNNELAEIKAQAINMDMHRTEQMDNVVLYVAKLEGDIYTAIKQVEEIIPQLQKATSELHKQLVEAQNKDEIDSVKATAKKYKYLVNELKKLGFTVAINAEHKCRKDGNNVLHVEVRQGDGYGRNHISLGSLDEPSEVLIPVNSNVAALEKQHKAMADQLADAQRQLLTLKVKAQEVNRWEREGKSLVIRNERMQTPEGRKLIESLEKAADGKLHDVKKYVEELAKSTKLLGHQK